MLFCVRINRLFLNVRISSIRIIRSILLEIFWVICISIGKGWNVVEGKLLILCRVIKCELLFSS